MTSATLNKNMLPPLSKWRWCGDECYGTSEPSYVLDTSKTNAKVNSARIARVLFFLKWSGTAEVNGRQIKSGLFDTPEEALEALNNKLL